MNARRKNAAVQSARIRAGQPGAKVKPTFKYKPRFGLIVEVATEQEQAKQYEKLKGMGFDVRVVTV